MKPTEQISAVCALITGLAAAGAVLWKIRTHVECIVEGLRCQLRSEMLRTYYRHKDEKAIRQYERENFDHNFKAYRALGGNSFIGAVYDEVSTWEVLT